MTKETIEIQKQSSKGVLKKRCSENMQQIYRATAMPKCDFTLRYGHSHFGNHTSVFTLLKSHFGMGILV